MLWRYSASAVADCYFGMRGRYCNRYLNFAVLGSEAQRVIHQIAPRALEQNGVSISFAFAAAMDGDMPIFRERSIKRRDLFNGGANIKQLPLDRSTSCVHSRHKEEIVHDPGQPFAFDNARFDDFAILAGRALPC